MTDTPGMVERVKAALAGAEVELKPGKRRSVGYCLGVGLDHFGHDYGRMYGALLEAAALAAIEAMMEPTEGMEDAGYGAACRHDHGDTVPDQEIAKATWQAMIKAALDGK